jgi:hypothetical protein
MRASLSPEISVVETPDTMSYELPDWQAGRVRRATVFGLWGGLIFCCGLMFTIPVIMTWAGGRALDPVAVTAICLVACPADLVGLMLLCYAGYGAPGRDRIELTSHGIAVVWQLGRLRRSRGVPWHEIARLAVEPAGNEPFFANAADNFILWLIRKGSASIRLAGAEDHAWLLALAGDLARRSKELRSNRDDELTMPASIEIVEEPPRDVIAEREVQPPDSAATVGQNSDGVTITIPPLSWAELFKAPGFTIALAITTALWAWIVTDAAQAAAQNGHVVLFTRDATLMAWTCVLVFSLIVIHIVNRRAQISAKGGILTVRSRLLVGTRCRTWRRGELADIRVVSKLVNSDAGQQWTQYIEIQPLNSGPFRTYRMLHWREKAELEWIATTLRRVLGVPAKHGALKAATEGRDDEIS